MIEEPPRLTIHTQRRRPAPAQVAALRDAPITFVADALGGSAALGGGIAPLDPAGLPMRLCGPALTARNGPEDILASMAALSEIAPGDVLVVATGGWQGCAVAGDRFMGMARNCGAAGLVTDGPVRDHEGILAVGLPVFCTGLSPNSPFTKGPGEVGGPVTLGGQRIESGDIILGDRDGVVVIPFARIEETIARLEAIHAAEATLDRGVEEGLTVPQAICDLLASDAVRRV